jgi:hypothetical protein
MHSETVMGGVTGQLPSHQLELPVVLAQDSIASIESVDLEPIPESVV